MNRTNVFSIAGGLLLLGLAAPLKADTTFTVNSKADDSDVDVADGSCLTSLGECTLRAAVQQANQIGNVTILVPAGGITLTHGYLHVQKPMAIRGAGMYRTILDGSFLSHIFFVYGVDGEVVISDMALTNGKDLVNGGAIHASSIHPTTLRVERCYFVHNQGIAGGAINADASVTLLMTGCVIADCHTSDGSGGGVKLHSGTIRDTTFFENSAATWGGGVHVDGGTVSFVNCTVSGNTAVAGGGGGIEVGFLGTANLYNTTVAYNICRVGYGGGVSNEGFASNLTFANSIISNNFRESGGGALADDCNGEMGSYGHSIVAKALVYCTVYGSYAATDPLLWPLETLGGDRPTHALRPGSPAIDTGAPGGCTSSDGTPLLADERGVVRPVGGTCDMGAYEHTPCGDVNGDGVVNVSDALFLINHLFSGGPKPPSIANLNGDMVLNVADVLFLVNYLFAGGPAPSCLST